VSAAAATAARAWRALLEPERPQIAVEVRPTGVGVVRLRREGRATVLGAAASMDLPPDVVRPSLTQPNLGDRERFRTALRGALERAGVLGGAPVALILPDPAGRIALVPSAEVTASRAAELDEIDRKRVV